MLGVAPPPCDQGVLRGAPNTPGCASQAKRWVLGITVLGSSTAFVEGSAINVALPAIQQGVGASLEAMQWIASIYTLFLAALTLAAGSAGDRWGRRPVFALGIAVLAAASAFAGLVGSGAQLIAARALQGVGAALLVPNSLALLSAAFPKPERGRAIGTWSAATSLTGLAGPLVGGLMVDAVSWRAAFFVVIPLTLVTLIARSPACRTSAWGQRRPRIDWWGLVLGTAGLGALVFGLISSAPAALAGGLGLLAAFGWHEAHTPAPMVPPRLFRSRTFVGANVLTLLLYFALSAFFFVLPFDLVRVHGYSAAATGAAFLPFALASGLVSRLAGGLADRVGPRVPMVAGVARDRDGVPAGGAAWCRRVVLDDVPPRDARDRARDGDDRRAAHQRGDGRGRREGRRGGVGGSTTRRPACPACSRSPSRASSCTGRSPGASPWSSMPRRSRRRCARPCSRNARTWRMPRSPPPPRRPSARRSTGRRIARSSRRSAASASCPSSSPSWARSPRRSRFGRRRRSASPPPTPPRTAGIWARCSTSRRARPAARSAARLGQGWVHLRVCLSCGYVGCCDSSRNRHATAHFFATAHPIVRSLEPGESWRWCYVDEAAV
jgi:MFS family permease